MTMTGDKEFEDALNRELDRWDDVSPNNIQAAKWAREYTKQEARTVTAKKIADALDGVAAVNLEEPTMDDLPRISNAYWATRKQLAEAKDRLEKADGQVKDLVEKLRNLLEAYVHAAENDDAAVSYEWRGKAEQDAESILKRFKGGGQ